MIRVLHITGTMDIGGIENFIMNVYRNIDREKIQFDFLLSSERDFFYSDEIKRLGGRIYSVPSRAGGKGVLKNMRALDDFFKEHNNYKIIHQHVSSLSYITPLVKAKKHGIPYRIIHSHSTQEFGNYINVILHNIHQNFIENFATEYLSASSLAANWTFPNKVIKEKKYKIIKNAIDIEEYKLDLNQREKVRQQLGIKENDIVIGNVGRLVKPKNHRFILQIFQEMLKIQPNYKLLLVGDGNLKEDIQSKIKDLGLDSKVILTGTRTDINSLLNAMDIFLFPSLYEGLGIALIEAQLTGLRCFTSKDTVPPEVNITGLVDFISLDSPPGVWAKQINSAVDYEREDKRIQISEAGYNIKSTVKQLEELYLGKI